MKTLILCALLAGVGGAEEYKVYTSCFTPTSQDPSMDDFKKLEKRVAELEEQDERFRKSILGLVDVNWDMLGSMDRTDYAIRLLSELLGGCTIQTPTINPHPFGTEPDSHDKPLPDNVCPKCGKNMVKESDGLVLTSYPPQYPWHWKCGCGHVGKAGVDRGLTQDQMFMNQWNAVNP